MGAMYLAADGEKKPIEMGCYGIGVSRRWRRPTSSTTTSLVSPGPGRWRRSRSPGQQLPAKTEIAGEVAEQIERIWKRAGLEVLLDDRDELARASSSRMPT